MAVDIFSLLESGNPFTSLMFLSMTQSYPYLSLSYEHVRRMSKYTTNLLEFVAQITQRNKQNFLCKHSIQQPKIARLIKDQIFTSIECAEIDSEESPRARFTLAKFEPLRSLV